MFKKVCDFLRSIEPVRKIGYQINSFFYICIRKQLYELQALCRKCFGSKKYSSLAQYKDRYKGKRCFVVCTGPSLTFEDLKLIEGEYAFGMNSILKIFGDTTWRPTFYGVQDIKVFQKMHSYIDSSGIQDVFISDIVESRVIKGEKVKKLDNAKIFPLNLYGHQYNCKNPKFKFSDDISACVYDGYSITYSLIQIACYMGFKEIYLLGCDNSYAKEPEKQYFVSHGIVDPNAQRQAEYQRIAFECAKKHTERKGIHIYNATRGGALEVFPRVNLDEVMK